MRCATCDELVKGPLKGWAWIGTPTGGKAPFDLQIHLYCPKHVERANQALREHNSRVHS